MFAFCSLYVAVGRPLPGRLQWMPDDVRRVLLGGTAFGPDVQGRDGARF